MRATLRSGHHGSRVLDCARTKQCRPVFEFALALDPRRRNDERLGTGINKRPGKLREPQVITGHEADCVASNLKHHWLDRAGQQPIGLAITE